MKIIQSEINANVLEQERLVRYIGILMNIKEHPDCQILKCFYEFSHGMHPFAYYNLRRMITNKYILVSSSDDINKCFIGIPEAGGIEFNKSTPIDIDYHIRRYQSRINELKAINQRLEKQCF